jgi:polar amino acid transport system substrate-binding protein
MTLSRRGFAAMLSIAAITALSLSTAAHADALSDAKARGTLQVGVEAGGTGAILSQKPDGTIVGQDADLVQYIGKEMGLKIEFVPTAWPGIIPALLSTRFDMIMSGMTATPERAQKVSFSIPYGDASLVAAVPAGSKIASADDLPGKAIGVLLGTNTVAFAKAYNDKLVAANKPGLTVKTYDDIPSMITDMTNGNIDGLMLPRPIIGGYAADRPGTMTIIAGLGDKSYFAVAMRKEDTSLLDAVNKALEDAKKDGTLAALQTKWLGAPSGDLPESFQ